MSGAVAKLGGAKSRQREKIALKDIPKDIKDKTKEFLKRRKAGKAEEKRQIEESRKIRKRKKKK